MAMAFNTALNGASVASIEVGAGVCFCAIGQGDPRGKNPRPAETLVSPTRIFPAVHSGWREKVLV